MRSQLGLLIACLALLAGACLGGGSPAGGDGGADPAATPLRAASPTGEPIRIGALFDLTGPTSDAGARHARGVRSQVAWVNATGGVAGRPLELVTGDHGNDPRRARRLYARQAARGATVVSVWGPVGTALRGEVQRRKVPVVASSSDPALARGKRHPLLFTSTLTSSQQLRIALTHLAGRRDGRIEVAFFHHDSALGRAPIDAGREHIARRGLDVDLEVYEMPTGAADHLGALEKARARGTDYLVVHTVAGPAAQLVQNAASEGLAATPMCLAWCADELFAELAGEAADGALGLLPWVPPSEALGDLTAVAGQLQSEGGALEEVELYHTQGWYQVAIVVEAVERLVVGGASVTGENVRRALETMGPYGTPVSADLDFTPEDHAGLSAAAVHRVEDGRWRRITEPLAP